MGTVEHYNMEPGCPTAQLKVDTSAPWFPNDGMVRFVVDNPDGDGEKLVDLDADEVIRLRDQLNDWLGSAR